MKKFFQIILLTILCGLLGFVVYLEFAGSNIFVNKAETCYEQGNTYDAYYNYYLAEKLAIFNANKKAVIIEKEYSLAKEIVENLLATGHYYIDFENRPEVNEVTIPDYYYSIDVSLDKCLTICYETVWENDGCKQQVNNVIYLYHNNGNYEFENEYSYLSDIQITKEFFANKISEYLKEDVSDMITLDDPYSDNKEKYHDTQWYYYSQKYNVENRFGSFDIRRTINLYEYTEDDKEVIFTIDDYCYFVDSKPTKSKEGKFGELSISYPDCLEFNDEGSYFTLSDENGVLLKGKVGYEDNDSDANLTIYMNSYYYQNYLSIYPDYTFVNCKFYDSTLSRNEEYQISPDLSITIYSTDIEEVLSLLYSIQNGDSYGN